MKKYKLFLFVFALFIILSSLNINSASADILGCMPGDNFSRTTGQACGTASAVVVCPSGDLFSSVTGQRCTTYNETSSNFSGDSGDSQDDSFYSGVKFKKLFKSSFRIGSRGNDIKALQQFLKDEGYYFGKVDGKYGKISARAVEDFQDDNNITIYSVVKFNDLFKSGFKIGARGDEVKAFQRFLKEEGYYFGKIDGKYGRITARAVKDFQEDNDSANTVTPANPPVQACVPRPACFDSEPKCLLMEPITGWCSTTQPFITVLSPNGGEKLVEGKLWTINWKGGPPDDMAIITLLAPNFQPDWSLKIAEVPNTGSYNWTVFFPFSALGVDYHGSSIFTIDITLKTNWQYGDSSDAPFSIVR